MKSRRYTRTRPPLFITGGLSDFRLLYGYLVALDDQRDAIETARAAGDFQRRLTAEIRFDAGAQTLRELLFALDAWPGFRVDMVIEDLHHGPIRELRYKDALRCLLVLPEQTTWISRHLSIRRP